MTETSDGCRIDVWLWRARFFKTRNLAARMVEEGSIRLLRQGAGATLYKPSRLVRIGDTLAIAIGERRQVVRIEAMGERRGPALEARLLYRMLDGPGAGTTEKS